MTISNNISLLASSNAQTSRLVSMHSLLDDLQRQATTQKKFDTLSGFGPGALNLQRLHTVSTMTQSYLDNIEKVSQRMTLMNNAMTQISKLGNELISSLNLQTTDPQNMQSVVLLAQQNLKFVEDLINQQVDGRYLFGGSDSSTPPFADDSTLNANFASQTSVWFAGGQTTAQMTAITDAFTTTNLGLSQGLATAGAVTARIDDNLDIDYTVKADEAGFKDIIAALTYVANLHYPQPPADVATPQQLQDLVDHISATASRGVTEMNNSSRQMASKFSLLTAVRDNHISDRSLFSVQIDKIENADPTEVITNMQTLQTQLSAAYQITSMVSQLSLVNFL